MIKKYQWLFSFCIALTVAGRYFHLPLIYWIAAGTFLLGLFIPILCNSISWVWKNVIETMGKIISGSILSILFFFLITPLSFLRQMFGGATMTKGVSSNSNFITKQHTFDKSEFGKTW